MRGDTGVGTQYGRGKRQEFGIRQYFQPEQIAVHRPGLQIV